MHYNVARSTAAAYNQAKGNRQEAARACGLNPDTFYGRVQSAKQKGPHLFKDFPAATGGRKLPTDQAKMAWEAFQEAKFNRTAAASALHLPLGTFNNRLRAYANSHKIDLKLLMPSPEAVAAPTLDDNVRVHRAQQ